MILKSSIREFLRREREDYARFKDFTDAKLQRMCDRLPVRPPLWTKLSRHQRICFLIGVREKTFLFMLDTGMGKTLLSIALHRYFLKLNDVKRTLVLVPNKINKYEWAREVRKHSMSEIVVLHGSSTQKWDQLLNSNADLVVTTFAGVMRMVTELKPHKKKERNTLVRSTRLTKLLCKQFNGLIMDECTLTKNRKTLPFRICRQLAKSCKMLFGLSGTPFGDDPIDLWSQMWLVDRGYTLGETLGLYRAAFFNEKAGFFGGTEYTFDKTKAKLLHRVIGNKSIEFEVAESDLPRVVPVVREIRLPTDAQSYYNLARDRLVRAHGNFQEQSNAFLRMLQISSGFIGYENDETGKKAKFNFNPNPKLDMLMADIEAVRPGIKSIVFHNFIHSGDMIARELKVAGIGFLRIGGTIKDDPEQTLSLFDKSRKHPVLILGNDAGGFGLNLQIAQYGFRFEVPVGAMLEKQAKRRFIRQYSQHDHVFLYDYVVEGTRDAQLHLNHRKASKTFDAVIRGR